MSIQAPKKRRYSISEAATMTGIKPHTLRLWEDEFSILRPRRSRSGIRFYLERDLKIVQLIKRLLYEEKYTISGAKQRLKSDKALVAKYLSEPEEDTGQADLSYILAETRNGLQRLLEMIEPPESE